MFDSTKLMSTSDDFVVIRESNSYFVDRTLMIKNAVDHSAFSNIVTRPKGFGKTTFLTMMRAFLDVDVNNPGSTEKQQKLFANTKILEEKEICQKYMGQFPCIYFSFKEVKGRTYDEAYRSLAEVVCKSAHDFVYLLNSPKLDEQEKSIFSQYLDLEYLKNPKNIVDLEYYLRNLTWLLNVHFDRYVFQFIDDFEKPIFNGKKYGFHLKISSLVANLLWCLRDEYSKVKKAYLCSETTVCNPETSDQLSHCCSYTMKDSNLTSLIGFTYEDVELLLRSYGLSEYKSFVEKTFGGYELYEASLIRPSDVVTFVNECIKQRQSESVTLALENVYISDLLQDDLVYDCVKVLVKSRSDMLQALLEGKKINFDLNYHWEVDCYSPATIDNMWTILVHKGFLTIVPYDKDALVFFYYMYVSDMNTVKLPNNKIKQALKQLVENCFIENLRTDNKDELLVNALYSENIEEVENLICDCFSMYVDTVHESYSKTSYYDFSLTFMDKLFSNITSIRGMYKFQRLSDDYAEISFTNGPERRGVVIGIKSEDAEKREQEKTKGLSPKKHQSLTEEALSLAQNSKTVNKFMHAYHYKTVYVYGIRVFKCYARAKGKVLQNTIFSR